MSSIADKWKDEISKAFENEDGILQWIAYDSAGNKVTCYWNGSVEMHIKPPRCDCGCRLIKFKRNTWKCPSCNRNYKESDMLDPIVVEYLDFAPDDEEEDFTITQDYGEYFHPTAICKAGFDSDDYYDLVDGKYAPDAKFKI